jgi:hypothetical protein
MTLIDCKENPPKRSLTVSLSSFSFEALAGGEAKDSEQVGARLAQAVRVYLNARDSKRLGWSIPAVLRAKEPEDVELELVAEEQLLRAFEEEAGRQGASLSQLAGQAALYYAAELDAGRLTQRVLDDLEDEEPR